MIEAEPMDGGDGAKEGEEGDGNVKLFTLDPFVQPPILKALFEQMPVEDLEKCRLVSKLWCDESLSTWRSKATLKFGKEGLVSTRDDGSKRTTSIGEYLDLWEAGEWGSCPFKRFTLDSWTFKAEDVEQQRFLELVGGHVTSLTLEGCTFVGRDHFRKIIYQAFPKLQFLKIDGCMVDNEYWYEPPEDIRVYEKPVFGVHGLESLEISSCHPHSVMDLLSHFHKLKSLFLDLDLDPPTQHDHLNVWKAISLIRAHDQTKLPLKKFDVQFPFEVGPDPEDTATYIELLRLHDQLNLPLQRLKLRLWSHADGHRTQQSVITDIFKYHSSTLKDVEIRGEDKHGLCKSFPFGVTLDKLEALNVPPSFFENLNFLKYTPKLRALRIYNDIDSPLSPILSLSECDELFSNSSQLEIGDWTLPSLKELNLSLPLSICNMKKLMKWVPNVEHLGWLELDDPKFSLVCNNWKNLKSLVDYRGSEVTDEGVLGIGNAHEAGGDEETQRGPNITKLKDLTSFDTNSSKLTSASVYEGFLKLANLKKLSLGHLTKLDDEAKDALEKRKITLRIREG